MALSLGLAFGFLGCLGLRTSRPPLFFDMTTPGASGAADFERA
jgi:hypothetical protein